MLIRNKQCYLELSIIESVPSPMDSIHTVGQTVAHHPLVTTIRIPPLCRHFGHCSFPPKENLQPLVTIVMACAPGPSLTLSWDLIKAGKLRNVIGVVG